MMKRRNFLVSAATVVAGTVAGGSGQTQGEGIMKSKVSLVKGIERATAIPKALELLDTNPVKDKQVLIKPNFNTADPFPASVHNDALTHLILRLREMGATNITIGERCGPANTADVLRDKGIYDLCRELDVALINFEELPPEDWITINPEGSHWQNGFDVARPILDAESIVSCCCLKTHGFGGVFTMSLKLGVGLTHKRNMPELHGNKPEMPNMRKMVAEINLAYSPSLILIDGTKVFTDGGPATGTMKRADIILAGTDRIAVDAVGVAILRDLGAKPEIMKTPIFQQEQISRAVELGLGVAGPEDIELVTDDQQSRIQADKLTTILLGSAA